VISVDHERKRIGLSMRQLQQDPWEDHIHEYKVGQLVEGTITRLVKFGAFARLDENIEGLIHISELSEDRIEHPKEVLNEGDTLALRIIKIEAERRRIGLSLRKVDAAEFSDMDLDMALAEISEADDTVEEVDPGAELKLALGLTDEADEAEETEEAAPAAEETDTAEAEEDAEADAEEAEAEPMAESEEDAEAEAEVQPVAEAESEEDAEAEAEVQPVAEAESEEDAEAEAEESELATDDAEDEPAEEEPAEMAEAEKED
jgi:ribosomal protein S1